MSIEVPKLPLTFYVDKIIRAESFQYLSYGDGEFLVAAGKRTGKAMQCGEVVTPQLEEEIRSSLLVEGGDIYRGTDGNIVNWRDYQGRDFDVFSETGKATENFLQSHCPNVKFVDGVFWEYAARDGEIKPLIDALRNRIVVLISNPALALQSRVLAYRVPALTTILRAYGFVAVPKNNAFAHIDEIEKHASAFYATETIFIGCMGLGAIPLAMRLRAKFPNSTFLDLGSTFDVFAGLGSTRGWRNELYRKPGRWYELLQKNLGDLL